MVSTPGHEAKSQIMGYPLSFLWEGIQTNKAKTLKTDKWTNIAKKRTAQTRKLQNLVFYSAVSNLEHMEEEEGTPCQGKQW